MVGRTISHYQIRERLGAGGMGEVYLAHDTQLGRPIALKILPGHLVSNHESLKRFVREAKMASAVNHPNVAHIYEIGEVDGVHFIAMEYIEGETLATKVSHNPLDISEVIRIAVQITGALQAAHSKGIIHRDIKPANIMITPSGETKLLDFGLAKVDIPDGIDTASWISTATKTELGIILGTIPYMSPEQLRGKELDNRTDFFSLGVVLFQVATGHHPFQANKALGIAEGILHQDCPQLHDFNHKIPSSFSAVISKLLAKERDQRYRDATQLLTDLKEIQLQKTDQFRWSSLRSRSVVLTIIVLSLVVATVFIWLLHQNSKARWARNEALLQITRLIDEGRYSDAVALGFEAEKYIPTDPLLKALWPSMSNNISIQTSPPGAEISMQDYKQSGENWKDVGKSPIINLRIPKGYARWRVNKAGFRPISFVAPRAFWEDTVHLAFSMEQYKNIPSGMTRIPGMRSDLLNSLVRGILPVQEDYWMDEFEVSNRDFKKFVDFGGYDNHKFWKVPFIENGVTLTFDEAMKKFRDATGRPGPPDWEVGNYPKGQDDYPVSGVSWYEAAAYAEFVGKSLPTVHHWLRASGADMNYQIIPFSNFNSLAPIVVSDRRSMSPFGTYNMAGNVKEWCWNESPSGNRFIAGGSYVEPVYKFPATDQLDPFARLKTSGFRCVKYLSQTPLQNSFFDKFKIISRNYQTEKPVDDAVFQVLKTFYSYENRELGARLESSELQSYLKKEKVSFEAAYGRERMAAYLFLPVNKEPPYQTIVYFPSTGAQYFRSSENINEIDYSDYLDFLVRSGRAVIYPVYKGTFERGGGEGGGNRTADQVREWGIQTIKDVSRAVDYLESRNDIEKNKIAFYGNSWGARAGGIVGAVENRFKTMILLHGGLPMSPRPPEIDEINFVPHVQIPVLMINGQYDSNFPVESSQKPMFRLLGTPNKDKAHVLFETGHTSPRNEVIKIVLDWLDRYLGPVK